VEAEPTCFVYPTLAFRRVNLGGWFVLEPFISPALFEKYLTSPTPPVDEYALSQLMRADGSINDLEKHYQTFIVSQARAKRRVPAAVTDHIIYLYRPKRTLRKLLEPD
jgi:hypothetical protein